MNKTKKTIGFCVLLLAAFISEQFAYGQKHIDYSRTIELPDKVEVFEIIQDSQGFFWYGTSNGLFRFDGLNFTSYKNHHGDSNSLIDDIVYALLEDSQGNIWIGTKSGGISVLNPKTHKFKHFVHDPKIPPHNTHYFISDIFEDTTGNIWVASQGAGIGKYSLDSGEFQYYRPDAQNERSIGQRYVNKIIEGDDGHLWIGLNGRGVDKFDPRTGFFEHYPLVVSNDPTLNFRNNVIRDLWDDDKGNIWTATYGGFNKLEKSSGTYSHYDSDNSILKTNSLNSIHFWEDQIYLTSYDGYLYTFDPDEEQFLDLQTYDKNIRSAYRNNKGNLLLGFTTGEVAMQFPNRNFPFYAFSEDDAQITSVSGDNKRLVFGTLSSGIFGSTPSEVERIIHSKELEISDIAILRDGSFWFGTYNAGLWYFDSKSGKLETYRYVPDDPDSIWHDTVLDLYLDPNGDLWIGTLVGLCKWANSTKKFSRIIQTSSRDHIRITAAELWAATQHGVAVINPQSNSFKMIQADAFQSRDSLLHNEVNTLYTPDRDSILIGSKKGLNLYLRSKKKMLNLHNEIGLPYQDIKGIAKDQNSNYLLLSDKGLCRLNLSAKSFKFFNHSDGLKLDTRFGKEFFFEEKSQTLIIGTKGGYYRFAPEKLHRPSEVVPVVIDEIRLFNSKLDTSKIGRIDTSGILELPYDQNMVSFSFLGLDFKNPSTVRYAYKMQGLDDRWIYSDDRLASFTNLDPGKYTFIVKAAKTDGDWISEEQSIDLKILPPPWATYWAYTFYLLCFAIITYFVLRNIKIKQNLKEKLLFEQLEVEKAQEIHRMKSRFFANISHEFRTPLTLITGPVEDLLERDLDKKTKKSLSLIQKNSTRLKRLINQLLDYSSLEENKTQLRPTKQDLFSFLRALASSFRSFAEKKEIEYILQIPLDQSTALFDQEKLEVIVYNLISNALKFTPVKGKVIVSALVEKENENASFKFKVTDSGPGLTALEKHQVFQRFQRLGETNAEGTGIGLALTRELVHFMDGQIRVFGEKGKGASFEVDLPIELLAEGIDPQQNRGDNLGKIPLAPENLKKKKEASGSILVVEDHEDLRSYILQILEGDWRLISGKNGREGFSIAKDQVPDLIISDLMMPEMNGEEFCRRVRQDEVTAHIPFIMLTARAGNKDKIKSLGSGANDYLIKPFDKQELRLKVTNLLKQRAEMQKRLRKEIRLFPEAETPQSAEDQFIFKLRKMIFKHLSDPDLNVRLLGRKMGLSRVQLYRKVLALTGLSTSDFIRNVRIRRAAELLEAKWGTVSEVAYEVGFNNLSYFTKCFKEIYKQTPSAFLKTKVLS